MKIAILSEKYTPDIGGLAISTGRLAHLLHSAGHHVHIYAPTFNLPASERRELHADGIRVTRFGAAKRADDTGVDWFELVVAEHKREPFDVLHGYFLTQAGFVTAYAGRYLNLPSVVSARGNDLERAIFDPARAAHILYALKQANAVTANTNELAKKANALVPGLEVSVIPNGVDRQLFKPLPRNTALLESLILMNGGRIQEAMRVIGFAGELRAKKGLEPLLAAYARVAEQTPCALLVVGDVRAGEDRQMIDEFKHLHPEAQLIITGFVSPRDLPEYYSLMDVFIQPSLRDGLPNALLEAMSCGRAVIATPVGGMLDAITDCENGKFVSTNNAEELARAIDEIFMDDALRMRLGHAARQTIAEKFTPRAELDANLAVYERLGLKV